MLLLGFPVHLGDAGGHLRTPFLDRLEPQSQSFGILSATCRLRTPGDQQTAVCQVQADHGRAATGIEEDPLKTKGNARRTGTTGCALQIHRASNVAK